MPSKNKRRLASARNSRIPAKPGQKKAFAAKERKERVEAGSLSASVVIYVFFWGQCRPQET
jgi:hypothetical protein